MYTISQSTSTPRALAHSFFLSSALLALSACGGGDGGSTGPGGTNPPLTPQEIVGTWNFEREGFCNGTEFEQEALPMQIELAVDELRVRLLTEHGAFDFPATLSGRTVTLSGTSTSGGTTVAIIAATLEVLPGGVEIAGTMETLETPAQCTRVDQIRAYLDDGTASSPVLGNWLVAGTTSGTACPPFDDSSARLWAISPRRAGAYSVWLTEEEMRLDAFANGAAFMLSGAGDVNGTSYVLEPGSELVHDPLTLRLTGEVRLGTSGGACAVDLVLHGVRPENGTRMTPILRDVAGAQEIIGLRGFDDVVVLPAALQSAALAADPDLLDSIAGIAYESATDAQGSTESRVPSSLFYVDGQKVWSLDLRGRTDGRGNTLIAGAVELDVSAPAVGTDLFVRSCDGPIEAVIAYRAMDGDYVGYFVYEDGRIVEVYRPEPGFVPIGTTFDPVTREIDALLSENTAQRRLLRSYPGNGWLIGLDIEQWVQGDNGSIWLLTADQRLRRYDSATEQVVDMGQRDHELFLGEVEGDALWALEYDDFALEVLVVRITSAGTHYVSNGVSTAFGGAPLEPAALQLLETNVMFQCETAAGRQIFGTSRSGTFGPLIDMTPSILTYDMRTDVITKMDDTLFVEGTNHFGSTAYNPDILGAYYTSGISAIGAVGSQSMSSFTRNDARAVVFVAGPPTISGADLGIVPEGFTTVRPLDSFVSRVPFSAPPAELRFVDTRPYAVLSFRVRDAAGALSPGTRILWTDLLGQTSSWLPAEFTSAVINLPFR